MGSKLKFYLPAVVAIGLFAMFYKGLYNDPTLVVSPFLDQPAPAFDLPSLQNPDARISDDIFKGQISLFNVWASWCPGCAQEHEMLLSIAKQTSIPIYSLNWKDERTAALKWLETRGDPYKATAFDRENIVGIEWGVYGAPETFLIDAEGIIRYKHVGPITPVVWSTEFAPRINAVRDNPYETTAEAGS